MAAVELAADRHLHAIFGAGKPLRLLHGDLVCSSSSLLRFGLFRSWKAGWTKPDPSAFHVPKSGPLMIRHWWLVALLVLGLAGTNHQLVCLRTYAIAVEKGKWQALERWNTT